MFMSKTYKTNAISKEPLKIPYRILATLNWEKSHSVRREKSQPSNFSLEPSSFSFDNWHTPYYLKYSGSDILGTQ